MQARTKQQREDRTIERALAILSKRVKHQPVDAMSSPAVVRQYLTVKTSRLEHELFSVLYLDAQQRLIEHVDMFRGTVTQTSVYPREVVKHALKVNAACVILSHNHPSGTAEPSNADKLLTNSLRDALKMIDVTVLDHLVVGGSHCLSFAELGLL